MPSTGGRRQLICSWCSQCFFKQEHLARHVRSHTHEKPFSCNLCGKSFSRNDTLLRHARGHRAITNRRGRAGTINGHVMSRPSLHTNSDPVREPAHGDTEEAISGLPALSDELRQSCDPTDTARATTYPRVPDIEHLLGSDPQRLPPLTPSTQTNGIELEQHLSPHREPRWTIMDQWIDENSQGLDNMGSPYVNLHGLDSNHPSTGSQEVGCEAEIPAWLTSADFDLNAFHSSIIDASAMWPLEDLDTNHFDPVESIIKPSGKTFVHRQDAVRTRWLTSLPSLAADNAIADAGDERNRVDETYREDLSRKLLPRVPHEPLPSTDFLNLCIQMYFTRFSPIFPLIHAPTFRPSSQSSLLLLSICSLGSLFLGSPGARLHGHSIFERLNKAIMASWETILASGKSEGLTMTQAGVIGQTFGMLSGRPRDLLLVQGLHGTVITWAKRCGIFQSLRSNEISDNAEQDVNKAWRRWAKKEELYRVATALYIHDAEYSALFNTEPLLRHSASKVPILSSDELWMAPTAVEWKRLSDNASRDRDALQSPPASNLSTVTSSSVVESDRQGQQSFSIYCELEGIAAVMAETRDLDVPETLAHREAALTQFHGKYFVQESDIHSDPFCLEILWHLTFISLFADLNRLEICAGRDGYEESQRHLNYIRNWAESEDARRCAVHSLLILRKAETMNIGAEPAIHVPRALFCAVLVWYCYIEFGQSNPDDGQIKKIEAPELDRLRICGHKLLFEAHGFKHARPTRFDSGVLARLQDLLKRSGHWEISRKFASLTICMVYGDVDGNEQKSGATNCL